MRLPESFKILAHEKLDEILGLYETGCHELPISTGCSFTSTKQEGAELRIALYPEYP